MCWTIITGKALGSAVTLFLRMVTRKQEKSQSFIWDIITPGKNNCSPSCPKTQHCENTIIYSSYWCHKIFCLYVYLCPFIVKSFIFKYFQKQEISLIILWIFWGYICECLVCWKNSTNVCETKLEDTDAPLLQAPRQSSLSFGAKSTLTWLQTQACHLRTRSKPRFAFLSPTWKRIKIHVFPKLWYTGYFI